VQLRRLLHGLSRGDDVALGGKSVCGASRYFPGGEEVAREASVARGPF
jgi:hypothetical protein